MTAFVGVVVTIFVAALVNKASSVEIIKAHPFQNSTCEAPTGNK